jgi:hypothetical protein
MKCCIEEHSYPSKDKGNSDVWHWFEILGIDNTIVLLIRKPHGVDDLLDVFVVKEALPLGLCGTHFLVNRLV